MKFLSATATLVTAAALTGCSTVGGGGPAGQAAAIEACEQWKEAMAADEGTPATNRAISAAERASSDPDFRYLATDMRSYSELADEIMANVSEMGAAELVEYQYEVIDKLGTAGAPIKETCSALNVDVTNRAGSR